MTKNDLLNKLLDLQASKIEESKSSMVSFHESINLEKEAENLNQIIDWVKELD